MATNATENTNATRFARRTAGSLRPKIALSGLRSRGSRASERVAGVSVSGKRVAIHTRLTRHSANATSAGTENGLMPNCSSDG